MLQLLNAHMVGKVKITSRGFDRPSCCWVTQTWMWTLLIYV